MTAPNDRSIDRADMRIVADTLAAYARGMVDSPVSPLLGVVVSGIVRYVGDDYELGIVTVSHEAPGWPAEADALIAKAFRKLAEELETGHFAAMREAQRQTERTPVNSNGGTA